MVDNSSSMSKTQARLAAAFPKFMQVLGGLPGGMPNLHIAVVSSDMGAGEMTNGCNGNGQAGIFQAAPAMTDSAGMPCATTLAPGAHFLSNVNGVANYTAPIAQVFSCIAALGEDGCGFEQPLLSVAHALGADNIDATGRPRPPLENEGFLRDDAYLLIVLITNEDDCSALGGAANEIFPRASGENLLSPLGPPTGYRCSAFGHLCGTPPAPPPIVSPLADDPGDFTTVVKLDDCVPSDGAGNADSRLHHRDRAQGAQGRSREPDPDLRNRRSLPRQFSRDALRDKLEEVGVGRPERAVARGSALLRVGERRQLRQSGGPRRGAGRRIRRQRVQEVDL